MKKDQKILVGKIVFLKKEKQTKKEKPFKEDAEKGEWGRKHN